MCVWCVCVCVCVCVPLIDVVGLEDVDPVDVGDVEDGLVTGRVWKLHQDFVQEHRLDTRQETRDTTTQTLRINTVGHVQGHNS